MFPWLRRSAVGFALLLPPTSPAAYPIDCAILLCLVGGWPANPHCDAARAEFVRRITPWPVEPPLQIWRCPMGSGASLIIPPSAGGPRDDTGREASAFDPTLSIQVHHIRFRQRSTSDGQECYRRDASRVGVYDEEGEFRWTDAPAGSVPSGPGLSGFDPPPSCRTYQYQAVAVSWRDASGGRGFEEVRY